MTLMYILDEFLIPHYFVDLMLDRLELIHEVGFRFNEQVVAYSKLFLNVEGCIKGQQFSMGHDTNSVSKFISLF